MTLQPSPASSPSPTDSQRSRKRQRSQSTQSDASSSWLKRTAADPNSTDIDSKSPRTDRMSTLTIADSNHDIDAYMADQGEDDIPALVPEPSTSPQILKVAPAEERVAFVDRCKLRKMEVGEMWYLVARHWWKRWRKALTGEVDKEGPVNEQDLGPVDNSPLLDSYNNLLTSISEGVDLEFVPEEVWRCFVSWYGEAIHPLPRRVIERGTSKQASLELRPPVLRVFRLVKAKSEDLSLSRITVSAGETIKTLNTLLAAAVVPEGKRGAVYRVWKINTVADDQTFLEFPVSQLTDLNGNILEDGVDKTLEEECVESDDCFVVEFKDESGWLLETVPAPPSTSAGRPEVLFKSSDSFFNRMSGTSTTPTGSTSVARLDSGYSLSTSWKSSFSSISKEKPIEPGTLGLGNMGNTCFMNSALQCLAHSKELTDYFLTGLYQEELNPDNPLGMHGAIAQAFGALLQRIWASSGTSTSYSPREFKSQLQRFAPQFSGYQQHDSQELVAFLLDGLHEDLNRVLKKPYVEKPDWEGGGNLELVKLAKLSWEGYMKRNDSVIVDLFQGQYQSTLICPECEKVSITFDPFMYLTLPLPVNKKWKHSIYYVPWDIDKPHRKVPVEISGDASFKDLKVLLGRWMVANPENLLTLEIFNNKFYKNLGDNIPCGDMSDNDTIVCFELPCNSQQSRSYKRQIDDPIIVPMYLCDLNPPVHASYISNKGGSLFGYPSVVAITPQQATDVNAMYDAVLGRLQRWTANARDLFKWEVTTTFETDLVPITLNGFPPTPADSLTEILEDGKVVTHQQTEPIDGDIVDEKGFTLVDDNELANSPATIVVPRPVGTKKDVFNLRLQANHKDYGTQSSYYSSNRWESWDRRIESADEEPILLREGDAFYCEFDENMKAYYFGDDRSRYDHALWNTWPEFQHPEYLESKKSAMEKGKKGLTLQDCLEEFTKEEKLGEDDLWYCPQCKKHQQATKKFDLWKAPDVLVVHLKRFSNSRTLRDKIDTFIDFPIEGLDLSSMVGDRAAAKKLAEQGFDLTEFDFGNLDEPLVYDLFGVDEHMGGLGGGHYRAYALNHLNDKWYHFDDSFVTTAKATDAVNANAYLLFYRRRSSTPLGGKTHHQIEEARLKRQGGEANMINETQLPTPPNEDNGYLNTLSLPAPQPLSSDPWSLRSQGSNSSVASPSPDHLPLLEESQGQDHISGTLDPLLFSEERYDFPDPSAKASPTSSNEVEIDSEDLDEDWVGNTPSIKVGVKEVVPGSSPDSRLGLGSSSSSSSISDIDSFDDANIQKGGGSDLR